MLSLATPQGTLASVFFQYQLVLMMPKALLSLPYMNSNSSRQVEHPEEQLAYIIDMLWLSIICYLSLHELDLKLRESL